MSTMDSQLLTLSSIFTMDIFPFFGKAKKETSVAGRIFVILLSLAGLALAYKPPATILQIATQTFTGLAVLFPTAIFGLYFKRDFALAAILSIGSGEAALIGHWASSRLRFDSIGVERKIIVPDKIQPPFGFRQGQRAQLDAIAADQLESLHFF